MRITAHASTQVIYSFELICNVLPIENVLSLIHI